jgi:preprotein translocase subunit SecG
MQSVIIVIHLMIVMAMIGVVLLQKSEGGGLGMGGGGGGFLTSRGTANVLTRTTAFLALGFFVTSLLLSILAGVDRKPRSIIQNTAAPATQGAPAAPGAPQTPPPIGQPGGGGLLDALRGQGAPPAGGGTPPQSPQP